MGARWYDPAIGRWLSLDTIVPDPANPQSLDRLSYVQNNPLKYIDPTGHCEFTYDADGNRTGIQDFRM
jgi:RHS repeat-associated protein